MYRVKLEGVAPKPVNVDRKKKNTRERKKNTMRYDYASPLC